MVLTRTIGLSVCFIGSVCLTGLGTGSIAFSQPSFGLYRGAYAASRVEALVSCSANSDAFLYNPAALASVNVGEIALVRGALEVDQTTSHQLRALTKLMQAPQKLSLKESLSLYAPAGGLLHDDLSWHSSLVTPFVFVPHFAAFAFTTLDVDTQLAKNVLHRSVRGQVGAIFGTAVKIRNWSFGAAFYRLIRSEINLAAPKSFFTQLRQQLKSNTFDPDSIALIDNLEGHYGSAWGQNIGLQVDIAGDGAFVFGAALLDATTTKFFEPEGSIASFRSEHRAFKKNLLEYGLGLSEPASIVPMLNSGLTFASEPDSAVQSQLSIEYDDVVGTQLRHKFAISGEASLNFPSALPALTQKHFREGLLGLRFFGGYRPGDRSSFGFGTFLRAIVAKTLLMRTETFVTVTRIQARITYGASMAIWLSVL